MENFMLFYAGVEVGSVLGFLVARAMLRRMGALP